MITRVEPADELEPDEAVLLTDEEIAALSRNEPLSLSEIVARRLTGSWADIGIEQAAAWVNDQKTRRRDRNQRSANA